MTSTLLPDRPLRPGTCEWCGAACKPEDTTCGIACEAKLVRHEKATGRAVLRAMKEWRMHRGRKGTPGEGAMGRASAMIDALLKEDTARRKMMKADRQQKGPE